MNKSKDGNQRIAKAILNIRKKNGLSQEEFAERLGISRQAVSRWEMGISVPSINTIISISDKFDVSLDEMLKGEGGVYRKSKEEMPAKNGKDYSWGFLVAGILFLINLPLLAEMIQTKNMEIFKTAYEHSYDYILEYPLSIVLLLSVLLIGSGIHLNLKKKGGGKNQMKRKRFKFL